MFGSFCPMSPLHTVFPYHYNVFIISSKFQNLFFHLLFLSLIFRFVPFKTFSRSASLICLKPLQKWLQVRHFVISALPSIIKVFYFTILTTYMFLSFVYVWLSILTIAMISPFFLSNMDDSRCFYYISTRPSVSNTARLRSPVS